MSRDLAPGLVVAGSDTAVDAERETARGGYLEDYQQRYGRLPWEDARGETADECCIGLKGLRGDDSDLSSIEQRDYDSSPGVKADATAVDGGDAAGVEGGG